MRPEDEAYRIEWGPGSFGEKQEGEMVDPDLGYRDYPIPPEAVEERSAGASYEIYANVYSGAQ